MDGLFSDSYETTRAPSHASHGASPAFLKVFRPLLRHREGSREREHSLTSSALAAQPVHPELFHQGGVREEGGEVGIRGWKRSEVTSRQWAARRTAPELGAWARGKGCSSTVPSPATRLVSQTAGDASAPGGIGDNPQAGSTGLDG